MSIRQNENWAVEVPDIALAHACVASIQLSKGLGGSVWRVLTDAAIGTEDNLADVSALVRTSMPESVFMEAIGVTTGVNVIQGGVAAKKAKLRFSAAQRIGDTGGMFEGGIDTARGISQSLAGAAWLGYRGTAIVADLGPAHVSASAAGVAGVATHLLGLIGSALFSVFFVLISIWSGYSLWKDHQLGAALDAASKQGNDVALFDFLVGRAQADPKQKLQKVLRKNGIDGYKIRLEKTALDELTSHFLRVQSQLHVQRPLSKSQARKLVQETFEAHDQTLRCSPAYASCLAHLRLEANDPDLQSYGFSMLELIGFQLEEGKRQCKVEAKFSRVTDGGCVKAVQKAAQRGLRERLESSDSLIRSAARQELAELKAGVLSANSKCTKIHAALLAIAFIGLVVFVGGFLGLAPIVATVLSLVLFASMLGTDGYGLIMGWNNGPPGKYDKLYLLGIAAVLIATLATGVALTVVFALPLVPCIAACAFGALGLGVIGYSLYRVIQKEKRWKEEHPDLETFHQLLIQRAGSDLSDEKVIAVFKKLPKADRRLIKAQLLKFPQSGGRSGFVSNFFEEECCALVTDDADPVEQQTLVHGIKKTARSCWAKYARERTRENLEAALEVQAVYDSLVRRGADCQERMSKIQSKPVIMQELGRNLQYVLKRQESREDLKAAVVEVILQKKRFALEAPAHPLTDYMVTEFANR